MLADAWLDQTRDVVTDKFDPQAFAERWAAAWGALDIEQILAHYADDCSFTSPLATALAGAATLHGRASLAAYWSAARSRVSSLRFEVDRIAWDSDRRTLVVVYLSTVNGQTKRAAEVWVFDAGGRIRYGEAFYGAAPAM